MRMKRTVIKVKIIVDKVLILLRV